MIYPITYEIIGQIDIEAESAEEALKKADEKDAEEILKESSYIMTIKNEGGCMENVLESIRQEQIRLIADKKDTDIAIYHRLKDYLDEAERQIELYIRQVRE
jgi:uncharacterized membrane protein